MTVVYLCTMRTQLHLAVLYFFTTFFAQAQELKKLGRSDFDLRGNVKRCTVITDYGREAFEFDAQGTLIKTITHYNEQDQDVTQYIFNGALLVEKRMESFKNGVLDAMTSMVNFYEYDSLGPAQKIKERIVSYDKDFLEEQQYLYDADGRLVGITSSNSAGVDEKRVEYAIGNDGMTQRFFTNGILEKSVRRSMKPMLPKDTLNIILTKEFIDGQPVSALEEQKFADGRLFISKEFVYNMDKEQFEPERSSTFYYNEDNILEREGIQRGNSVSEKQYIFQFDNHEPKNWVRKITTPGNEYVARKIEYFDVEATIVEEE